MPIVTTGSSCVHPFARASRVALTAAAVAAAGVLAGCPPQPPPLAKPPVVKEEPLPPDAPVVGSEPVSGGVYEPVGTKPLDAAALEKARLDRGGVFDRVKLKVVPPTTAPETQPAATVPAERSADATPPMAVKYYLQGRERFLQGANSEAMDQLEKSLQLDPEAFTVLRLMGRVCFAASQLARGSMYLERAHRLRPDDVETNYLLGRYWLERKDYDRAIYYLMRADDSPERQQTSTQTPLSAFYLARALQAGGYHLAAAKEFERFMSVASLPVPGYRYDRELSYLIDEQWASALAAAENFARVGEYAGALPHYEKAATEQPKDAFIASRTINALVHTGRAEAARERALALVAGSGGTDDAIKLLGWTYRVSGREGSVVDDLRARLASARRTGAGGGSEEDASLALTLSMTQEYLGKKADAFATLIGYLRDHPKNVDVLGRLLKRVDSAETFRAGLSRAGAAIAADRNLHGEVMKLFLPVAEMSPAAAFMKEGDSGAGRAASENFATAYLAAITARVQNAEPETIERLFSESLRQAADFAPARDGYVSWLLAQEKFPRATEIVQTAVSASPDDPGAWVMLVRAEAAQQRYLGALKLAQDAKRKFPANTDVRMELVNVYRLRGQDAEADAELNTLINEQPKNETAYRALINAMLLRNRRGGGGAGAMGPVVTLLARMNRELPNSRYAQVHSAMFFARGGRLEEAEGMFRRLQADTPDDPDVLIPLAQIRQALGHTAEAMSTLNAGLKSRPQPDLVRALATLYREDDKPAEALALTRRMTEENPDVEAFVTIHAAELTTQGKNAEALDVLKAAVKRFPRSEAMALALARQQADEDPAAAAQTLQAFIRTNGETTERLYALSHFQSSAGDMAVTTATLQRILAIMPDHIGANNDLGYFWVDEGIRIAEAEKMILKAVENEPNNPAFLDSIGWLYYKQGKFAEAAAQLNKAIGMPRGNQPDVLGHLGDALYRAGRKAEAVERWRQAFEMINMEEGAGGAGALSAQDKKTRTYLEKAIKAASGGDEPELSPLAEAHGPATQPGTDLGPTKSAGPAGTPATLPQ
jgi:tetratricopeptide (TPR) repeat protein